ncbi:MAG: GHKL domain-containing protein [Lachnospiraceae bacterium]|nr:GHKL domain-containing protein [Lachnospiraceae bacterium]
MEYKKKKWKNTNLIWIAFYVLIMYSYRFAVIYDPGFLHWPIMILYLVRIIPFICAKYGARPRVIFAVPFYSYLIECIAENIMFIFMVNNIPVPQVYPGMNADVFAAFTETLLFLILLVLALLKREKTIRVRFTELTPAEYIILSITCTVYGILEAGVYRQPKEISYAMKCLFIFGFAVFLVLVVHVITVRKQNSTMNTTIGNLKEPMKQITESYIEMNEKNTELRKFRHDTKNLLLALGTLIKEGKYDQASEYIDKMQETIGAGKIKMFETGNFIADALLESKAKTASSAGIAMSVDGNIPSGKIEDVDLVILISNLLDNAIEAAAKVTGEKEIGIKSILKENIWILNVKNPCDMEVIIKDNRIETTRDDKESHGFGLANIESITRKYEGKLELSCENKEFIARAVLTFDT